MKIKIFNRTRTGENTDDSIHLYKQAFGVLAAALLGFSGGLTVGITSALLPQLENNDQFHWTKEYSSWMASFAPISSILSCICIGRLLDRFGRKTAHIIITCLFIIGWLFMAFANNFYVMMVGRFFTGFAYGGIKSTSTIYLGEISDPKYRGVFLMFPSLSANIGILSSHAIGSLTIWKTAFLICVVPNILMFVMYCYFKESPYWLICKGRIAEGTEYFRWFRGTGERAESELRVVIENQENKGTALTSKELLKIVCSGSFVKPTVTLLFVFVAVQLNGANSFNFYANDLIVTMFNHKIDTFLVLMIMDVIRVAFSIFICLIAKNIHRRALFIYCSYAIVLLLVGLASVRFYDREVPSKWIPLTLILLFSGIATILTSLGWSFVAEIFPTNVRGLGSGLAGAISYVLLSLSVKITPNLLAYGEPVMYGADAAVTVVSAVILHFILPETHGKTLQDIEDSYNNKKNLTRL